MCYKELTFYQTITTFNKPEEEGIRKQYGEKKILETSNFSFFPTMFSTCLKTNFDFSVKFILSSANTFNLNQSEFLSFGKKLMNPLPHSPDF